MNTKNQKNLKAAKTELTIRFATDEDFAQLTKLEIQSFRSDRISRRRIKHWISAKNGIFLVAIDGATLAGYVLVLLHRGTKLARLYSIAVASSHQGQGLGTQLLKEAERLTAKRGRLFMRLEVAKHNHSAIKIYESLSYKTFGTYTDYYEDHDDALRMQKRIRHIASDKIHRSVPWYQQTTEFTCGPASAIMAMAALDKNIAPSQELELDIWREATTIFMTSGHGGCHPIGLAIAAKNRNFNAAVYINQTQAPFLESVRSLEKKKIMTVVHNQFVTTAKDKSIPIYHSEISQDDIETWLSQDALVLMLISTYRMDSKKAPHWVTIAAMDELCFYVHDPDPTEGEQSPMDCQYLPIARDDFDKMSQFGREKLRTAVVIYK
ncbi:GNAT family N-acetyltransferase/peptidase C39 family protein [Aurantivibrio infirmus]